MIEIRGRLSLPLRSYSFHHKDGYQLLALGLGLFVLEGKSLFICLFSYALSEKGAGFFSWI